MGYRRQNKTFTRLSFSLSLLIVALSIAVVIASMIHLENWQNFFFTGSNPITRCDIYGENNQLFAEQALVPHKRGFFKNPKNDLTTKATYQCRMNLDAATIKNGVYYLHLGWIFADHTKIYVNDVLTSSFSGPDKPIIPLATDESPQNGHEYKIAIHITGKYSERFGLTGLQGIVYAQGSQINARILAVDYALSMEANLFSILPNLSVALIVILGIFLGLRGRVVIMALCFFGLSLSRCGLAYFSDFFPWDLTLNYYIQIPLAVASGFVFILMIWEALRILPHLIYPLFIANFVTLALMYVPFPFLSHLDDYLAALYKGKRLLAIVSSSITMALIFKILRHQKLSKSKSSPHDSNFEKNNFILKLGLFASLIFFMVMVSDSLFQFYNLPIRLERFLDIILPFLVATILVLNQGETQKSYIKSLKIMADQQEENIRLKSIAMAVQMISHDIRKPFEIFRLALARLARETQHVAQKDSLLPKLTAEVENAIKDTEVLLQDLMSFDQDEIPCDETFALNLALEEALNICTKTAKSNNIKLTYSLIYKGHLKGKSSKMVRALTNLIDNAAAACADHDFIEISSTELKKGSEKIVELRIKNHGSYLDEETCKKVFIPFYTAGKKNGTGLGLPIVFKIVANFGGSISCHSEKVGNSCFVEFCLTLPCPDSSPECDTDLNLPSALKRPETKKLTTIKNNDGLPKIAFLEDNLFVQDLWLQTFASWQINVFTNPEEFFDESSLDYDLIITDFYFGKQSDFNGLESAQKLRDLGYLGLIALSSQAELSSKDLNFFDYILDKEPTKAMKTIEDFWSKFKQVR